MTMEVRLKDPRVLRIFLSSPFNGMKAERDCLTCLYWPRLKSALLKKGLLLRIVDLRWGITSEMASDNQTFNTCLREVDRSDIFVGMYGRRYGWHGGNDETFQKNIEKASDRFPWVKRYRDRSATELEFLHGHLNDPGHMAACFAFRDQNYDEERRRKAIEAGDAKGELVHTSESEKSCEYIQDLKERVSKTKDDTIGVIIDYPTPEDGAEFIFNSVMKYVNENVLETDKSSMSKWDRAELPHQIYLKSRTGTYIGGDQYLEALDKYVSQEGRPRSLVITGPTGCEETALLGYWLKLRESRQDEDEKDIVIYHFVGAKPKSSSPGNLLKRLVGNLQNKVCGKEVDSKALGKDPHVLLTKLDKVLSEIQDKGDKKRKVIIIVDKVAELLPEKDTTPLFWLPRILPDNVRLIMTTVSTAHHVKETLDILVQDHNTLVLEIKPLRKEDKRALCQLLLDQHSKSMEPEQLDMILNSDKTANPFFLHTVISELCISGTFRELNYQIETFLQCEDVVELLGHMLRRVEEDYSDPTYNGNLVQDVLCGISLCRGGMSEVDFPMEDQMWTPIIYALEHYLINRSGNLSFAFSEVKNAVDRQFMPDTESRRQKARHWAEIFFDIFQDYISKGVQIPKRCAIELPHLLIESNDLDRLKAIVSNIKVFEVLSKSARKDLLDYWKALNCQDCVLAREYLKSLDTYVADQYAAHTNDYDSDAFREIIAWKANILKHLRERMEEAGLDKGVKLIYERETQLLSRLTLW